MKPPPDVSATQTYPIAPKKPRNPIDIPPRIDTNDPDAVYDLALRLQGASARRLMAVTHAEVRAIARLAAGGGVALSHAVGVVGMIDRGASRDEIAKAVEMMAAAVRPLLGGPK
jgi:hypothetical protein